MADKKENPFENLPLEAAEYIRLVIKKIRYRRKVRNDVQKELIAHFQDALIEITDPQEKQASCKELIEQFGDAKMLAVLTRRAKKRCRPLWLKSIIKTMQAIGIFVLLLILYISWFLSGKPIITTNYIEVLNKAITPSLDIDPNFNALPYYVKAAEIFEKKSDNKTIKTLIRKTYKEITTEDVNNIKLWINQNQRIFELLEDAAQKPYYWPNYYANNKNNEELIAVLLPHLASYRDFCYALCWRARINMMENRTDAAFSDLLCSYKLGSHLRNTTTLIEQLVAISIQGKTVSTVCEFLKQYKIENSDLVKLQNIFEELIKTENFKLRFEAEKLFLYDEIQRSFTADRIGGGHLYLKRVRGWGALMGSNRDEFYKNIIRVMFTHPNKQETLENANIFYDQIEKFSVKPPYELRNVSVDEEYKKITKGNLMLQMLTPAFGKVFEKNWRIKIQVESILPLIALNIYCQDKSIYPDNLQQLVDEDYLAEIPIDPFSGELIKYKKTDGDFILYSFGLNMIDDGGVKGKDKSGKTKDWADNGDTVFWSPE